MNVTNKAKTPKRIFLIMVVALNNYVYLHEGAHILQRVRVATTESVISHRVSFVGIIPGR